MARIRWTEQAADDLEAIAEYIARDSPHYASLFCLNVIAKIELLEAFPKLGRIVPETDDVSIRELLMGNYRIIYRLVDDFAEILTVYHGARILDPERLTLPE